MWIWKIGECKQRIERSQCWCALSKMQWSGGGLGSSSLQLPVLSRKLWACVWERLELSCNLLNLSEWWKILSGEVDGVGSVKEFRQGFIAYASWLLLYKSRKRFIFDGVEDNVTEVAKTVEMFSLGEMIKFPMQTSGYGRAGLSNQYIASLMSLSWLSSPYRLDEMKLRLVI